MWSQRRDETGRKVADIPLHRMGAASGKRLIADAKSGASTDLPATKREDVKPVNFLVNLASQLKYENVTPYSFARDGWSQYRAS